MWTNSLSLSPCNFSLVEAPSPSDGPGPTSHQWLLIIGLIAQSIKKEVAPLIFFIQTIHNVLSCKWIIKFTEISTQFLSNCILWNPFSFIILIETLFSYRGADWGGETCPLLVCCCENSFLFTHTYFREITSVYGMWGLVTNFKYTDAGQFILTSLRSYVLGESTKRNSLSWTSLIHCTLLPSPRLDKFPWIKFHRIYSKVSHTFRQFRVFLQVNCQPSPLFWISWHVPETRLFVKNKKWTTVI